MYKKILVAVDGSKNSKKAVSHAIDLASQIGAKVLAVHVTDSTVFVNLPETIMWDDIKSLLDEEGAKSLGFAKKKAASKKVKLDTLTSEGSPAKEIVKTAEKEKADLIILGTAGRGGIDKFLIGSVSEKVLRMAHCTVMIVK